jgi:hypothetical protein
LSYERQRTELIPDAAEDWFMNTLFNPVTRLRPIVGVVGAILLASSTIAAMTVGRQVSIATTTKAVAVVPHLRSPRLRCDECGVVTTTRLIERPNAPGGSDITGSVARNGHDKKAKVPPGRYEVTVRMRDGSSRVLFVDAGSAHWRQGERIILIEGTGRSDG